MTEPDFNTLSSEAFVQRYAAIVEHSPWVIERAADAALVLAGAPS